MSLAVQILINVFIAILWMLLQDEWSMLSLVSGYVVGLVIIFGLRRFFSTSFYLLKVYAAIKLLFILSWEFVSASILVSKQVLQRDMTITPGVFALETTLEKEWEVVLLALMLTLTPGSTVIEISEEGDVLYLHAMDIPESKEAVYSSTEKFEKVIKEVSR